MSYSHLILNMILVKEGLKTNQDLLDVEPFTKKHLKSPVFYLIIEI